MTVKSLKILLAATALGVGALLYSGSADARIRGHGWHYGWHKGWYRDSVVASDYYVAPRHRARHRDDCVLASDYDVAPRRRVRHRDDCVLASDCDLGPCRVRHDDCVLASDCDLGLRRGCGDDCVVASDYVDVAPPPVYDYGYCEPAYYVAPAVYAAPVVYAPGWYNYGPWGYGYGWPF
ncbi:MAG TPA: hypothetical protein VMJ31_01430 [Methylocystis sp.]|nr:hypothetical protein [Methylocystis sp.]